MDIHLRTDASAEEPYLNSLLTYKEDITADQRRSFAFALSRALKLCGRTAYTTNVPMVYVILLQQHDEGLVLDTKATFLDAGVTQVATQAGAYFVRNALNLEETARAFYEQECKTEKLAIRNFQRILSSSKGGMSLEPYFPQGTTAVKISTKFPYLTLGSTNDKADNEFIIIRLNILLAFMCFYAFDMIFIDFFLNEWNLNQDDDYDSDSE